MPQDASPGSSARDTSAHSHHRGEEPQVPVLASHELPIALRVVATHHVGFTPLNRCLSHIRDHRGDGTILFGALRHHCDAEEGHLGTRIQVGLPHSLELSEDQGFFLTHLLVHVNQRIHHVGELLHLRGGGEVARYVWSLGQFWFFTETAYTIRQFPSVVWQGDTLKDGMPTDLQASGWSITLGIQFPIR